MSSPTDAKTPPVFQGITGPAPGPAALVTGLDPDNVPSSHEGSGKILQMFPIRRNIFNLLARSHTFPHLMRTLGAIFNGQERTVPLLDYQLVVLRLAGSLDAAYEFDVNEPVARVFDMGEDKIAALKKGLPTRDMLALGIWSERQQCLITLVDESLATYSNKEETIEWAKSLMTEDEIVEIYVVLGLFTLIARITKGLKVQMDGEIPGLAEKIPKGVTKNAKDV